MSDEAERRIFELLERPDESPYGTPIPGLDEFGVAPAAAFLDGVVDLATAVTDAERTGAGRVEVVVRRLGEPVQSDMATLRVLGEAGVMPGVRIAVERDDTGLLVSRPDEGGEAVHVPEVLAEHIYIVRDA